MDFVDQFSHSLTPRDVAISYTFLLKSSILNVYYRQTLDYLRAVSTVGVIEKTKPQVRIMGFLFALLFALPLGYAAGAVWIASDGLEVVQVTGSAETFLGVINEIDVVVLGRDYKEAASWHRKAAEQGHVVAQTRLAWLYHKGLGVEQDYEEAISWYREAAEQGHILAQNQLGLMYLLGRGVTEDYKEAASWNRKAAEQGDAGAQGVLGTLYIKGKGVQQDYKEAFSWVQKAAEQEHPAAQALLGAMYAKGHGTKQDYGEAVSWYRKAAEQGNANAQAHLAAVYREGKGVAQDLLQAHMWFSVAVSNGDESVSDEVADIEAQMTAEEITEAEILAQQCTKNDYKGC